MRDWKLDSIPKFPSFHSERKKRTTSGGNLQFPNGFSGELLFHLTFNWNFQIFLLNVKHSYTIHMPNLQMKYHTAAICITGDIWWWICTGLMRFKNSFYSSILFAKCSSQLSHIFCIFCIKKIHLHWYLKDRNVAHLEKDRCPISPVPLYYSRAQRCSLRGC